MSAPVVRPFRRGLIAPAFFTLIGCAILVGLGTWQVERLAWKEDLLTRIASRIHAAPAALPPPSAWPDLAGRDYEYTHVAVTGRFDSRNVLIFRGSGTVAGGPVQPGYWVMTPFMPQTGGTVLVNRGFVPLAARDWPGIAAPRDPLTVTGLLRAPESRTPFTPADDAGKGDWFTRDPLAIASALGLADGAPFSIDEDAYAAAPGTPAGGATVLDIPNNHLSYAVTWFGLAATLVGVFAIFAWQRQAR